MRSSSPQHVRTPHLFSGANLQRSNVKRHACQNSWRRAVGVCTSVMRPGLEHETICRQILKGYLLFVCCLIV